MLKALVFDVDGTLADTESAHRVAFNHAFATLGLAWHWDDPLYTRLLHISGGKERMRYYWKLLPPEQRGLSATDLPQALAQLHSLKTTAYAAAIESGEVPMRPGVLALIEQAQSQGLQLAIATTTSPPNIAALLQRALGSQWRQQFAAIGDAATAPLKKPHPQVYLQVLQSLGLGPAACLAFEDSGNGLQAAHAAGIATVITPTRFTLDQDFSLALCQLPDLGGVSLTQLREWHAHLHTANLQAD